jgi:hypothetical protein
MKTTQCKNCKADFVFLQKQNGKWIPTDIESLVEGEVEEIEAAERKECERPLFDPETGHVNHLQSCPESPNKKNQRKRGPGV